MHCRSWVGGGCKKSYEKILPDAGYRSGPSADYDSGLLMHGWPGGWVRSVVSIVLERVKAWFLLLDSRLLVDCCGYRGILALQCTRRCVGKNELESDCRSN